jgi:lysophospholipase L1-like esterase
VKYNFDVCAQDGIKVSAQTLYGMSDVDGNSNTSYGFLTEKNRRAQKRLQIPELNSGFDTVYWYRENNITQIKSDADGCYIAGEDAERIPLTFITKVPEEGNYQVTITLYATKEVKEALVFLGRRRLAYIGLLQAGQHWQKTFITNICPIIPRGYSDSMEDNTLDVTVIGESLHLQQIEVSPVKCTTVYIAGDSTVTDQSADYPYHPYHSYSGWGQMLSYYSGTTAATSFAVSNHAHSGLTTESFRSEGHYKILLDRIKKGDICLFQFGHNDQKLTHLMADDGYRKNLIQYIQEVQEKGALPVIITPLARNTWKGNDNTYNDLLYEYAQECKKIAQEYQIPLADLHEKSMSLVTRLGRDSVKRYYFPSDYTHSNDYGAFLFAGYVYEDLIEHQVFRQEYKVNEFVWNPPEVLPEIAPPDKLATVENPNEEKLFEKLDRPEEPLTRVEALEFVITAMHFFPTNVYNDAFDDIVGHELYAGTVECAYQNGLIPDDMVKNKKFQPKSYVTGKEFIEIAMNGYQSRKGKQQVDIQLETIKKSQTISRRTAADICKQLRI